MAAPAAKSVTPDTEITIKVAIDGNHRRFRLPLKDLTASTLPTKLRLLLDVQDDQDLILERFSDSSGSFVTLNPEKASVYKQLYRAAKAKLKLRIKAEIVPKAMASAPLIEPTTAPPSIEKIQNDPNQSLGQLQRGRDLQSGHPVDPVADMLQAVDTVLESEIVPKCLPPTTYPACPAHDRYVQPRMQSEEQEMASEDVQNPPASKHLYADSVPEHSTLTSLPNLKDIQNAAASDASLSCRPRACLAQTACTANKGPEATQPGFERHIPNLAPVVSYSVYCNLCTTTILDAHYHCGICDGGDFDLCQSCTDRGLSCFGVGHWLIKRSLFNGRVINSTTETVPPHKVNVKLEDQESKGTEKTEERASAAGFPLIAGLPRPAPLEDYLTCNSCIEVYEKSNFVTCINCEDVDFCLDCFAAQKHGHHPGHRFVAAAEGMTLTPAEKLLCAPGGGTTHYAVCDGCDQTIEGVRHKCLTCPDWDYCSTCIMAARLSHPGHRFAPIYDTIPPSTVQSQKHFGIFCDGPLCISIKPVQMFIAGDRYKCAVCHDTDFCANCEASPLNRHNPTHPLIKFKTPVRNVSVSTVGENGDGEALPSMGDVLSRDGRRVFDRRSTRSTATETAQPGPSTNAATQVQIVADLKPSQTIAIITPEDSTPATGLDAHFVSDTIADGSRLPPNHVFTQTWTLYNVGPAVWPMGSSIKFVGGDNMRNVDANHPSSVEDLEKSLESNVLRADLAKGREYAFSVTLRTPMREGKYISYWRMTAPSGEKFGHKLWCDLNVSKYPIVVPVTKVEDSTKVDGTKEIDGEEQGESSQMIFPKLEKESPVSSQHEAGDNDLSQNHRGRIVSVRFAEDTLVHDDPADELESLKIDDEDSEGDCDDFNTDDEYDILDASDEEPLAEAAKK